MSRHQREGIVGSVFEEDRQQVVKCLLHRGPTVFFHDRELRPHGHERKPPPYREVQNRNAAVGAIHRAQDMEVGRKLQR